MYHTRPKTKLTSSFVFLVLRGQRISEIELRGSGCAAYLFWVYNDKIFVGRLSVGLVDDLGDGFSHGGDGDW